MAPVRIFISHSSKDRPLTEELCKRLHAPSGSQPGYDVLVDYEELLAGKPWPKQIHEWMAKCHAAVILLTKDAVVSPWVLTEATILAWRLSLDDGFRVFTVGFPDVTDEMLKREKFKPLMLGQIQRINSNDPDAIAAAIRASIGQPECRATPFDKLMGRLADLLGSVGENTLQEVAEKVRVEPGPWRPGEDKRAQYVEAIARKVISETLGGYKGVDELVDDLRLSTPKETIGQILRIVSPFWVDAEAAGRLPALTTCDPRRTAAMNGASVSGFTAKMYVWRAHPLSSAYKVISTAGGSAGDLVEHYTNEICDRIRKDENRNQTESNDAIISDLRKRKPTRYVVLPPPLPTNEALQVLHDRFPKVTFILSTGDTLDPDESLSGVEWLTPALDLEREAREQENYRQAEEIIGTKG